MSDLNAGTSNALCSNSLNYSVNQGIQPPIIQLISCRIVNHLSVKLTGTPLEKAEARLPGRKLKKVEAGRGIVPGNSVLRVKARSAAEKKPREFKKLTLSFRKESLPGNSAFSAIFTWNHLIFLYLIPMLLVPLIFGRRYGLIGRNGVGKSTFLRHIASRQILGIPAYLSILHVEQK